MLDTLVVAISPIALGFIVYMLKRFFDQYDENYKELDKRNLNVAHDIVHLKEKIADLKATTSTQTKQIVDSIDKESKELTQGLKQANTDYMVISAHVGELKNLVVTMGNKIDLIKLDTNIMRDTVGTHSKALGSAAEVLKKQDEKLRQIESNFGRIIYLNKLRKDDDGK